MTTTYPSNCLLSLKGLPTATITGESSGEKFIIHGSVISKPNALSIKWQKTFNNGFEDIDISLNKYDGSSENIASPILVVQHLTPLDTATYRLLVHNAIGQGWSEGLPLYVQSTCKSSKLSSLKGEESLTNKHGLTIGNF
jgi:hypothetical protein